jgi:hypothetical protein
LSEQTWLRGLEPALFRDLIQIFRGEDRDRPPGTPTVLRNSEAPLPSFWLCREKVMEYLGLDKASGKGYCKEA